MHGRPPAGAICGQNWGDAGFWRLPLPPSRGDRQRDICRSASAWRQPASGDHAGPAIRVVIVEIPRPSVDLGELRLKAAGRRGWLPSSLPIPRPGVWRRGDRRDLQKVHCAPAFRSTW